MQAPIAFRKSETAAGATALVQPPLGHPDDAHRRTRQTLSQGAGDSQAEAIDGVLRLRELNVGMQAPTTFAKVTRRQR